MHVEGWYANREEEVREGTPLEPGVLRWYRGQRLRLRLSADTSRSARENSGARHPDPLKGVGSARADL